MPKCRRGKRAKAAESTKSKTIVNNRRESTDGNERDVFLKACAAGTADALKLWDEHRGDCDHDGNNGVLIAAMHGQLTLLKEFTVMGADLNVVNANGDNALHLAAFQGHQEVVEWLEEQGVGIYVDNEEENDDLDGWGQAAVLEMYFDLVRHGDIDGLQQLVANVGEHIFPWNMVDEYQVNAIGIACENNQLKMLNFLTNAGGLSLTTSVNNRRDTAIHIAAMYGCLDIVRAISPKVDLTTTNAQKWTALDVACFYSQASIVWFLTTEFKNVFKLSISQAFLIIEGEQLSAPALLTQLIKKDSSLLTKRHGIAQETLLHVSASLKQPDTCKCLLSMGADPRLTDGSGWSTLQVVLYSKWLEGIPLFFTTRWCQNSSLLQFAMEYATLDMLLALYKLTESPHVFYQVALKANRNDVVAAIDKLHESLAEAIISQLSITPAQKAIPIHSVKEPEKHAPLALTKTPTFVRAQTTEDPKQSGPLRVHYLLTSEFSFGEHDDWGEVLIQKLPKREAVAARRFQQQLIRWELSQPASTQSFVRYLSSIDNTDTTFLLFESPGIPWSLAFQKPNTFACAHYLTRNLMKSAIEALYKLHCQSHPHGSISPSCLFIDATYSHTKLYVPSAEPSISSLAQTAPEMHEGENIDLLALDVFCLGQAIAQISHALSIEEVDLLDAMCSLHPEKRPTIAVARLHPCLWSTQEKLQYIEHVANQVPLDAYPTAAYSWIYHLPAVVRANMNCFRSYQDTLIDLVRWIRNFKQHGREHSKEIWQALNGTTSMLNTSTVKGQEACLGSFIVTKFPDLVLLLWQSIGSIE